jgi:hypothetical protein
MHSGFYSCYVTLTLMLTVKAGCAKLERFQSSQKLIEHLFVVRMRESLDLSRIIPESDNLFWRYESPVSLVKKLPRFKQGCVSSHAQSRTVWMHWLLGAEGVLMVTWWVCRSISTYHGHAMEVRKIDNHCPSLSIVLTWLAISGI